MKDRIRSFADLKENWDGYNADVITNAAIDKAIEVFDSLSSHEHVYVYPMRDGGVQFELGKRTQIEIEICRLGMVTIFHYDNDFNVIAASFSASLTDVSNLKF